VLREHDVTIFDRRRPAPGRPPATRPIRGQIGELLLMGELADFRARAMDVQVMIEGPGALGRSTKSKPTLKLEKPSIGRRRPLLRASAR